MFAADPRQHLTRGTPDRRCWECAGWVEWNGPTGSQPLGDCTIVRWMLAGHRQMTHADDACAKFEVSLGRTVDEREMRADAAGLG